MVSRILWITRGPFQMGLDGFFAFLLTVFSFVKTIAFLLFFCHLHVPDVVNVEGLLQADHQALR